MPRKKKAAAIQLPSNPTYIRVRVKHPKTPGLYYRGSGDHSWVTAGYDTWTVDEWRMMFQGQNYDGVHWDFYGEAIDLGEDYPSG